MTAHDRYPGEARPDMSITERTARIVVALTIALALAVISAICTAGQIAAESATPEVGIDLPIGHGAAVAAFAKQLATTGEAPGRVALWSVLAARSSPLRAQAFSASAITTRDAVLIDPLLEHARALSRLDPELLTFMIRRARIQRDYRGLVTYADELLRQGRGGEPVCGELADAVAVPAALPELARVLAAAPGWRTCFFAAAPRTSGASARIADLAARLARGPAPMTRAEANLVLQRLLADHDGPNAERVWKIATGRSDPFAWPAPADDGAALPLDWAAADGAAWDDQHGARALSYDLSGRAQGPVATKAVVLRRGRYRVAVTPATEVVGVRYQCGNASQLFENGAIVTVAEDCVPGTLELIGAARAGRITAARLVPQP